VSWKKLPPRNACSNIISSLAHRVIKVPPSTSKSSNLKWKIFHWFRIPVAIPGRLTWASHNPRILCTPSTTSNLMASSLSPRRSVFCGEAVSNENRYPVSLNTNAQACTVIWKFRRTSYSLTKSSNPPKYNPRLGRRVGAPISGRLQSPRPTAANGASPASLKIIEEMMSPGAPSMIHYLRGSPLLVKPDGHYGIQASLDGCRLKRVVHRLQPPNQLTTPGIHTSHYPMFLRSVQSAAPTSPQVVLSSARTSPVAHSQTLDNTFKIVFPVMLQRSHFRKSNGQEPHSGSKHGLEQSLRRMQGNNPQPQSTQFPSASSVYHGPQFRQNGQPRSSLRSRST